MTEFRTLNMGLRLYLPSGRVMAPVERSLAAQLSPEEFRRVIQPEEFSPSAWREICRVYARHWLENLDRFEPKSALFYTQLAVLSAGAAQTFANKDAYGTADAGSSYAVNADAISLHVKMWGAGGGSGSGAEAGSNTSGYGGPGAYVYSEINVIPGESLTKYVGGGGVGGLNVRDGGGGGGYTAVTRGASVLILAAGGGGGGPAANGNAGPWGGQGGNPGGNGLATGNSDRGDGATQSAGGTGGSGNAGADGATGSSLTGGAGGENTAGTGGTGGTNGGGEGGNGVSGSSGGGGGGGGGYYGGGGGEASPVGTTNSRGGGGGGGASYATGSNITYTDAANGDRLAPNSGDADYSSPAGDGASDVTSTTTTGLTGKDGRLVIIW